MYIYCFDDINVIYLTDKISVRISKISKNTVSVVGIGRVGLPLALVLAKKNFKVFGIGRDPLKIEQINKGVMPFREKGASRLLKETVKKSFLSTTDYSVIAESNYIVLTLGTPIDENMNPVFTQIEDAIQQMKPYLRPGQTLILRSTVSPGTTKYTSMLISDLKQLKPGVNFYIAYCPERIAEGMAIEEIETIPQIIGGLDKKSSIKAEEFFKKIGVKTMISDDVSIELAKLFTNMYRYINFAIANEFMFLAENQEREIHEIIKLVNFGYSRGGISSPGLTGGPCLFKDGFFLISDLPFNDLISTSWKINESVPLILINKIKKHMRLEKKKAVILGMAFKAEIDDTRESLSFKVRKALLRENAEVYLHDPFVKSYQYQEIYKDVYSVLENANLIFVATNHKAYKSMDLKKLKTVVAKNCMICDVWNVFGTGKILFNISELSARK